MNEIIFLLATKAAGGRDIYRLDGDYVRCSFNTENSTIFVDRYNTRDEAQAEKKRKQRQEFGVFQIKNGRPVE